MFTRAFSRRFVNGLAVAASCLAVVPGALAQEWPAKPVRIIVSFAPGGVTDLVARAIQPRLSEALGQPVVIDNRPGAGGTLAEAALARSAPDGYTLMMTADSVPANPHLIANLSYDTLKDLQPISLLARIPLVLLVNPKVPATTLKEFVAYAKANNGKFGYASPGIGTSNHLYFEVLKDMAGFDLPHVPYKGGGPAMSDLIAGHVPVLLVTSTLAAPQVAAGKVRALAVTSEKRSPQMPAVPTFAESGFADFKPQQWTGLFAPAGTPAAVIARVSSDFAKAMRAPDVQARLAELGAETVMSTQAEFANLLRRDYDTLGKLIKDRNIKVQ